MAKFDPINTITGQKALDDAIEKHQHVVKNTYPTYSKSHHSYKI